MAILVTGGAGYIGSHTVIELQNAGYDVVVMDNLSNSSEVALERVQEITGKPLTFYKADILDREATEEIFSKEKIEAVIHFAGLKAVGESVQKPWEYYENNIAGTLTLFFSSYIMLCSFATSFVFLMPPFLSDSSTTVVFSFVSYIGTCIIVFE